VSESPTRPPGPTLDLRRPVTTTDAWKLFAIIFVLIDHYGLYFDPDDAWLRVFGRLASPVFFFFIGFARTRRVPWTWLAFGVVITAVDYWTSGGRSMMLNILLNFALLRLTLPLIEAHVIDYPARLAIFVIVSAALVPLLDTTLEYSGEGWLWALFGLSHRLFLERGDAASRIRRIGLGVAAGIVYFVRERSDFGLDALQSTVLVVLVAGLILGLAQFRRADCPWQPPHFVRPVFTFAGRRTLEIYAVTLLAMQLLAYSISGADIDDGDYESDDAS
jgi:hypothetical protein